jgi:superoxide reductase
MYLFNFEEFKMVKENQIYRCEHCGNVVSVIEAAGPEIQCCGENMKLLEEKTATIEGKEKHVPIIEKDGEYIIVKVGSINHPMAEDHFIELIQLFLEDGTIFGKRLKPGDEPIAKFHCLEEIDNLKARALCNKHGLWTSN